MRRLMLLGLLTSLPLRACGSSKGTPSVYTDGGGTGEGGHGGTGPDGSAGKGDGGSGSHRDGSGGTGHDGGIVLMTTDGGSGPPPDGACGSVTKQAGKLPVDLVLVIETSFSMQFDNKWSTLSAALEDFVTAPASAGLDFGIQFFPLRQLCEPAAYQALAVPVGPQPMVAPLIQSAINERLTLPTNEGSGLFGATPTVQVLQGIIAYLQANAQPGHKPVIVMATDGVPDFSCIDTPDGGVANSLTNAEAIAAAAYAATPSIPIFIIGVGSDLTPLNALAAAGGTGSATLIAVGADAGNQEQGFINALNAIRQQSIPCDFTLPTGTTINAGTTNVTYTTGGGMVSNDVYVTSAAGCIMAPDNGWYFDNATAPTEVILCSGACAVVKGDPGAQINVVLGCPTDIAK